MRVSAIHGILCEPPGEGVDWVLDGVLWRLDWELSRLGGSLDVAERLLQVVDGYLAGYVRAGCESILGRVVTLLVLKQEIRGFLESRGLIRCRMDLEHDSDMDVPIPLRLECTGPTGYCFASGLLRPEVTGVEPFYFDEYWASYGRSMPHVLISDRWVAYWSCGGHNRVYVRDDGALVVSHDTVNFDGVHVVYFKRKIWEYVSEIRRLMDRSVVIRSKGK